MKFYYNGQLIRTSKSHIYTHAVIDTTTGKCKGCRTSREAAETVISSEIAKHEKWSENHRAAIKALESGKSGYFARDGRHTYFEKFNTNSTVERYTECIEWDLKQIEYIKANWQIVELEAR